MLHKLILANLVFVTKHDYSWIKDFIYILKSNRNYWLIIFLHSLTENQSKFSHLSHFALNTFCSFSSRSFHSLCIFSVNSQSAGDIKFLLSKIEAKLKPIRNCSKKVLPWQLKILLDSTFLELTVHHHSSSTAISSICFQNPRPNRTVPSLLHSRR